MSGVLLSPMSEADKSHPDNERFLGTTEFAGPAETRKCTDVLFFVLILTSWIGMTGLGLVAMGYLPGVESLGEGDPWRLINGIDTEGNICGIKPDAVLEFKNVYSTINASGVAVKICVKECPSTSEGYVLDYREARYGSFESEEFLNSCILVKKATTGNGDDINELSLVDVDHLDSVGHISADIWSASPYIGVFGVAATLVVALLYILLLRLPFLLSGLLWASTVSICGGIGYVGFHLKKTAGDWNDAIPQTHSTVEVAIMKILSYTCFVCSGLFMCLVVFLRNRIRLAVGLVRESARCVFSMPLIFIFPFLQTVSGCAYIAVWVLYALYLASAGDVTSETHDAVSYKNIAFTPDSRYALVYMVFQFFWTTQFIVALGELSVSMAVACWYFDSRGNSAGTPAGNRTVMTSLRRVMRYHAGTAAFGALILGTTKAARSILIYIQKKSQSAVKGGGRGGRLLVALLCCLQCCMWCLEKCLRFLNRTAYTQTSIFGVPFCTGARRSFFLLLRNLARVSTVTMVGAFAISIGRLFIVVAATSGAYFAMQHNLQGELHGLVAPTVFTGLLAYLVADSVMNVFDMAITTILQCFMIDEEMYGGHPLFASNELKEWVDVNGSSNSSSSSSSSSSRRGGGGGSSARGDYYVQHTEINQTGASVRPPPPLPPPPTHPTTQPPPPPSSRRGALRGAVGVSMCEIEFSEDLREASCGSSVDGGRAAWW